MNLTSTSNKRLNEVRINLGAGQEVRTSLCISEKDTKPSDFPWRSNLGQNRLGDLILTVNIFKYAQYERSEKMTAPSRLLDLLKHFGMWSTKIFMEDPESFSIRGEKSINLHDKCKY